MVLLSRPPTRLPLDRPAADFGEFALVARTLFPALPTTPFLAFVELGMTLVAQRVLELRTLADLPLLRVLLNPHLSEIEEVVEVVSC